MATTQQQQQQQLGGPTWANPGLNTQQSSMSTASGGDNAAQMENEFFAPLSTLDEPVRETIMRDVRAVGSKLKVVLLPMDKSVRVTEESPLHENKRIACRDFLS